MKTKTPLNYVRTQRRRWAFTQNEVAALLGFESRTCISRIEQGKRVPTLESALALEVLFGEPPKSLFPYIYAEVEDMLMQRAAVLYGGLINSTSPREKRKCELLELALKRATASPVYPPGV
ncbi:MAG: helix-turn-helix transcriptional regulator [Candidatus Accumulibacter sp. UW20]|jgi:DNA-binding XRE family transcriptional regulator